MNLDGQDYVNEDIFNVMWRGERMSTYDKLAGILVDENESVGERDLGLHLFTTSGFLDTSFCQWLPVRVTAMALAGGTLVVCGPPDVVKEGDPMAAFEGRLGSELWTISAPDGQTIAKHKLDETPIFDGLAVADDQLYLCTEQGEIVCMKGKR
jgi:hypothetical protein